jgi:hypothetical protein
VNDNCKGGLRRLLWLNLRYVLSRHFTGKTEENHEKPIRKGGLRDEIFARNLWNTKQ